MNKFPNRHVFKVSTDRLHKSKWNLKLDYKTAYNNKLIVDLADSTALRFIRDILNQTADKPVSDQSFIEEINQIKKNIKGLSSKEKAQDNKKQIKKLYQDYHNKLLVHDYILVEMKKNSKSHKDFDRANKGFYLNGKKFEYLLSTTGGVKNETVVYVSSDVYTELNRRIDNDRDMTKEFVPAKLSAYRSLVCSASIPVPDPRGVLVIKDMIREVEEDVIFIENDPDPDIKRPVISEVNKKIEMNANDGYGFISYGLAKKWAAALGLNYIPSAFITRNAYDKGVLAVVDFRKFGKVVAGTTKVTDIWENTYDVFEDKIDIVLTESMLKLWSSYSSVEDYLTKSKNNGYIFSVTKYTPKELESQRNLNYQFIQSLELTDEDIGELIKPTVDMIKDARCGDWAKTMLYLKGDHLTKNTSMIGTYDFAEALSIDKRMLNDPFVKQRVKSLISKRIDDAKKGDLIVEGNFSILISDPVALLQHMFGMKSTGLLKAGEFYSDYWNQRGEDTVVGFRAPMTVFNNIRKMKLVKNEQMKRWYRRLNNVFIVNTYDLTLAALNGADADGDSLLTTNNSVIKRRVENEKVIICKQEHAKRLVPTREDFIESDKRGFGNKIGSITNKGTSLYDVLSGFEKGSPEYNELIFRIRCIQKGQQDEIDKMKGVETKELPREWFDAKESIISDEDDVQTINNKLFNQKLVANLKPYFFIYRYAYLMNEYKKYKRDVNTNSLFRFGLKLNEILSKSELTVDEQKFINDYYNNMPVSLSKSAMNRICWRIEDEFATNKDNVMDSSFDYTILKTDMPYDKEDYDKVVQIFKEHNKILQSIKQIAQIDEYDEDEYRDSREAFKDEFKSKVFAVNNNIEAITNIVVDICYGEYKKWSKQFAWDIAGEQIILNLLERNENTVTYPILNPHGDIDFRGKKFKMITRKVEINNNDK